MKKLLAALLAVAILALPALADEAVANYDHLVMPIDDVEEESQAHWYDAAVAEVTAQGLMTGTDKGFEPEGTVTRAMVFQTLYNMEGRPQTAGEQPFAETVGMWYENAASWAYQTGLTTGTGEGFAGDRAVTRAETVTVLHRYARHKGVDVSVGEDTNILSYEDAENVAPWAVPAFQWAVGSGVVSGKNGALLAPDDTALRAELAQILCNYTAVPGVAGDGLSGRTVSVNKYGDARTNVTAKALEAAGMAPGDVLRVTVGGQSLEAPWVTAYDDVAQGRPLVLVKDGAVELCLSRGDFATAYGVGSRGDSAVYELTPAAVSVDLAEKGGYGERLELLGLAGRVTNNRADYANDRIFANFRAVTVGNIAPGVLYRSASPIETVLGRNTYADALLGEAGIRTIVNMADCRARAPEYPAFAGTNYEKVHNDGGTVYLNMGSDLYAQVGLDDLKNGLEFLTEREGPYLIHSTYGADRTGHLLFLLEALMGASVQDIVADYMLSFENLYHIKPDTEGWFALAEGGVEDDLVRLLGASDIFTAGDLARAKDDSGETGLERAARQYLIEKVGLTAEQVETLKAHLSTPVSQ